MSAAHHTEPLHTERDGSLLVLTLDREERRNALSPDLLRALLAAVQGAVASQSQPGGVAAIVLRARGEHFCAGGDLGPGGLTGDGLLAQHQAREVFVRLLSTLLSCPVPTVAAVQGNALGGGAGLVAACHMVVMATDARISTPELRLGLFPWMITPVLQRKLPANLLNEMILCGRKLSALEAVTFGFANRVVARDKVDLAARDLALAASRHSRAIVGMGLAASAAVQDQPLEDALRYMHGQLTLNLLSEDAAEGISAFLSRRPPQWKER